MATAQEARQALVGLTSLARRDLFRLWRALEGLTAEGTRDALADLLPALGLQYGDAAAALAADWYEEVREEAEAKGRFAPVLATAPDDARWESLAGWATSPLFQPTPDRAAALTLLTGGLQRSIADQHRLTVVESSIADPAASGWRRVGVGDNCGFCRMLIDRGHVYTEAGATFRSHDHCNCAASPAFADNVVKVSTEANRQSQTIRSDATKARDNARAREYIAEHYNQTT
jgi:hypothetical protein